MKFTDIRRKKRMLVMLIVITIIFIALIFRIGWLQFVQGAELKDMAYIQQTLDRMINPKRGAIYDATGKNILAVSASVETVTVMPTNIKGENKEKVAKACSEIFGLDYEKTLARVKKRSSIEIIVRKVEKEKTDKLRLWMNENNITDGINIDEDTTRYYPNNSLLSNVLGFCGDDNQGLNGIELQFDEILSGTQGKIITARNAVGGSVENEKEEYVKAVDGKDIVLTIDMNIQSIAEKYLKQAVIDNKCTDGGNMILMNPQNGDILAMVTYPNYNLNEPFEPNTEELKAMWGEMSAKDKNNSLQQMWRNKAITDTYETGSTFKIVTTSIALEENLVTTDKEGEFYCSGSIEVAGARIRCWRSYNPHGSQSLREALSNSCNPVFIGLRSKSWCK